MYTHVIYLYSHSNLCIRLFLEMSSKHNKITDWKIVSQHMDIHLLYTTNSKTVMFVHTSSFLESLHTLSLQKKTVPISENHRKKIRSSRNHPQPPPPQAHLGEPQIRYAPAWWRVFLTWRKEPGDFHPRNNCSKGKSAEAWPLWQAAGVKAGIDHKCVD